MKILVVDDEEDVELLLTQRFRKKIRDKELDLRFAHHGGQALEAISLENDFDLVLTDINMPVMDGLTLLSKMGGIHSPIMSIIISAYGDLDNIRTAMNLGAFDFITKPINFSDLDATLQKSFQLLNQMKVAKREHEALLGIQQELSIAREIQQSMIPALDHALMKQKGIDVSAVMIPAKEVGGDFYDFFFIDENRVGICIADVSGKGVPAALFMAMTKTLVKASAMSGLFPADCMDYVNRFLSQDNDTCMFVSVFFAILDLAKHELCYANGGHNLPYIVRKGSPPVFLQQLKGMVLGIDDGTYEEKIIPFPPGDILYTYTDGVTEAMNPQEELMGEARLEEILKAHTAQGPEHLTAQVLEEIKTFASGAPQSDDITMMALSLPFSYPGVTDSQA